MLKRGDIVVTVAPFKQEAFVLLATETGRPKNDLKATNLSNGKNYALSSNSVKKIGEAIEGYLSDMNKPGEMETASFEIGRNRAIKESRMALGADKAKWEILANAKAGDSVKLVGDREVKFVMVLKGGYKYVFLAEKNGKSYKYPLSMMAVDTPKRTNAEILDDLRSVECGLSGENLHCDGEASMAWVRQQIARLNARKKALIAELGRKPTDDELYPELSRFKK
jgi:hypothetical protein